MLVAAGLRLFHLGAQSLWIDEIFTWRNAGIGAPLSPGDVLENVHGPLYAVLLHTWGAVAGDGEWALRLPSALAGVLLVPVMAALAAEWVGAAAAPWAAWLTALSPFLVWYSQEARNYMVLVLAATLASLAALRVARALTAGRAAAYGAAGAASLLCNFSFVPLMPLHAWWWLRPPDRRGRRLAALLITGAGLGLLLAPWALQSLHIWDFARLRPGAAYVDEVPLRGAASFHPAMIPFTLHAFAVGYTLGPPLRTLHGTAIRAALAGHAVELALVTLVFGLVGAAGLRGLARRGRLLEALAWVALPAALVTYFAIRHFKVFHPRYLAVGYPAFLLALAVALADLRPRLRAAAAIALLALWVVSLGHHYFDPRYGKEDHRGAAALIRARGAAGEKVVAVNCDGPMTYYYRGPLPLEAFWLGHVQRPARLRETWDEVRAGARGLWVVESRPEDLDPEGRFVRFIETFRPQAFAFEGVRVWHWTAPGP